MLGPFQVLKPSLTLRPKETKPKAGSAQAGPIAWWKLDESSGATAANAAGTKFVGQLHGKPSWSPDQGKHNGALVLDSVNDWYEVADSTDLDFQNGLAMAAWFKARPVGKAADTLLAMGDVWRLQRNGGNGDLEFALSGPKTSGADKNKPPRVVCKRSLEDDQWHHIAAAYDGKQIALYVDGERADAVIASGELALNNIPLSVGENAGTRGRHLGGLLDDVRLYDRGLSAEEVKALFTESDKK